MDTESLATLVPGTHRAVRIRGSLRRNGRGESPSGLVVASARHLGDFARIDADQPRDANLDILLLQLDHAFLKLAIGHRHPAALAHVFRPRGNDLALDE